MIKQFLTDSTKKGFIYAITMIFLMMIGFHIITATLTSKLFSVQVLRGSIPEVRFMVYVHILIGFLAGWSASDKKQKANIRILQGLVSGITTGLIIASFDVLLNYMIRSNIDIRGYLSSFSIDSMDYFLLRLGNNGTLVHLGLYITTGVAGSALAVFMQSEMMQKTRQNINDAFYAFLKNAHLKLPAFIQENGKYILYAVLIVTLLIMPTRWGSYINFVVGAMGLYMIAGIGLNIIVGLSGQLMLGYAAFFAMGAYSVALLNAPSPHGIMLGFWPSLIVSVLMAVAAAVVLGVPIMRLRGDYLAIVTLGFGEIIRILLKSDLLTDFTGGPRGIHAIQGPTLFGKPFTSDVDYVYLIFAFVALSIFLYNRLQDSRTGRAWLAIKEDPIAAQATGINLQKYKLLALVIGAAFAGLVGGIMAARNQFTGPNDHSLMVSINVLSLVIVGGVNSIPGIFLGAFALKGLPEILREVENYRLLAFGALLIIMMLKRPDGLWPSSRPQMEKGDCPKNGENNTNDGGKNA